MASSASRSGTDRGAWYNASCSSNNSTRSPAPTIRAGWPSCSTRTRPSETATEAPRSVRATVNTVPTTDTRRPATSTRKPRRSACEACTDNRPWRTVRCTSLASARDSSTSESADNLTRLASGNRNIAEARDGVFTAVPERNRIPARSACSAPPRSRITAPVVLSARVDSCSAVVAGGPIATAPSGVGAVCSARTASGGGVPVGATVARDTQSASTTAQVPASASAQGHRCVRLAVAVLTFGQADGDFPSCRACTSLPGRRASSEPRAFAVLHGHRIREDFTSRRAAASARSFAPTASQFTWGSTLRTSCNIARLVRTRSNSALHVAQLDRCARVLAVSSALSSSATRAHSARASGCAMRASGATGGEQSLHGLVELQSRVVQAAADGVGRASHGLGDFVRAHSAQLVVHEDDSLLRLELLQRRLHQPGRLPPGRGTLGVLVRRLALGRLRDGVLGPAPLPAQVRQRHVRAHPVEERLEARLAPEALHRRQQPQVHLLEQVLHVHAIAHQVPQGARGVHPGQLIEALEGRDVAFLEPAHQQVELGLVRGRGR